MVYQVPASKASIKQNVFEFSLPDDKEVFSIPHGQYLNAELFGEMRDLVAELKSVLDAGGEPSASQQIALTQVQHRILEHYAPGLAKKATNDQIVDILNAWQSASNPDAGGVGLGESSASSDS